jgi:hypothetical protein
MKGARLARGALVLSLFFGCDPNDCSQPYAVSAGTSNAGCQNTSVGSCNYGSGSAAPNGSLGQGDFAYVCPSAPGQNQDAWCDLEGVFTESFDTSDADTGDAADALAEVTALEQMEGGAALLASLNVVLPDVAVGASFQLSYTSISPAPGLSSPRLALAALGEKAPRGTALLANHWAGFIVSQGLTVFDYTHIHARPVASLRLSFVPDATGVPQNPGSTIAIAASPLANDGTLLAGAITCTFEPSDPSVTTVTGNGRTATLVSMQRGDVAITVTCLGAKAQATLHFAVTDADTPDAGAIDGTVQDARAGDSDEDEDDASPAVDARVNDVGTDVLIDDAPEGG